MRPVLIASLLVLAACGGSKDEPDDAPPPSSNDEIAGEAEAGSMSDPMPETVSPLANAAPLTPGTYCYYRNDENVTEGLEIIVSDEGAVSGDNFGIIHQRAASYYAAFSTVLTGGAVGETSAVTFDTQTDVDGDSQSSSAIWYLSAEGAGPDGLDTVLEPVGCDGLEEKVQSEGSP